MIGMRHNLLSRGVHFDTTTLQLEGDYSGYEPSGTDAVSAYGYSKSHRHDLKQMVLNLATIGKAAFPIWMEAHSGNASDQKILPSAMQGMQELCKQLKLSEKFLYVADSAAYSNLIKYSSQMKWLSRVPASIKAAKELL